jgi:hypothetical protein
VLEYGSTENCQFGEKTNRNSIFLGHDPRIVNRLSIRSCISIFTGSEKFHIFARNPNVLAYSFTENCQFGAKSDQNSIFLIHDPRIANLLSIADPYFNFHRFWKFSHFCSKSMGVSLRFHQNLPAWGKNWLKLCISWSWPPYCKSVIYNGPVFQFLWVLKIFTFLLEIQRC